MGTQDDLFRGLPRIESGYLVQDASALPMRARSPPSLLCGQRDHTDPPTKGCPSSEWGGIRSEVT